MASRNPRFYWTLVAVLLAGLVFVARGPVRAFPGGGFDFALIYASARGWAYGVNPYDAQELKSMWESAGGPHWLAPTQRGPRDLLYPPPALVLLAPAAVWPWPVAKTLWLLLGLGLLASSIAIVAHLADMRWSRRETWWFVAAVLAMAPVHSSLVQGQTSIAVLFLIVLGVWAQGRDCPVMSGVLLGLAAALKPQVGGLFVCYQLLCGRWRLVITASVVASVLALIAVVRLEVAGTPWLSTLRANLAYFSTEGDGDPTRGGKSVYQLINLHHLYHTVIDGRTIVGFLVWLTVGGIAACAVYRARGRRADGELLMLGITAVISLLAVYHRAYDAVVLILVWAWCIVAIRDRGGGLPWLIFVCLAALWTPGGPMLHHLANQPFAPTWMIDSWWWRCLVVPHQTVALLIMGIGLVIALGRAPTRSK